MNAKMMLLVPGWIMAATVLTASVTTLAAPTLASARGPQVPCSGYVTPAGSDRPIFRVCYGADGGIEYTPVNDGTGSAADGGTTAGSADGGTASAPTGDGLGGGKKPGGKTDKGGSEN